MKFYTGLILMASVLFVASRSFSSDIAGPVPQQSEEYENFSRLIQEAVDASDPSICQEAEGYTFHGGDYRERHNDKEAQNNCYFSYANKKLDIDVCEKISTYSFSKSKRHSTEEMRDACIYQVQKGLNVFLKEHCDRLLHKDSWYGEQCAREIVARTQDDRICDEYFVRYSGNWHGCRSGLKP